jgi:hypothetical protein
VTHYILTCINLNSHGEHDRIWEAVTRDCLVDDRELVISDGAVRRAVAVGERRTYDSHRIFERPSQSRAAGYCKADSKRYVNLSRVLHKQCMEMAR